MFIAEIDSTIKSQAQFLDTVLFIAGLLCLGYWLLTTGFGRKALIESKPRPNTMPIYLPFVPLLFYMVIISGSLLAIENIYPDLEEWQNVFAENLVLCTGTILSILMMLYLAKTSFIEQFNGFGLKFKRAHRDFGAAVVTLVSIWPIIISVFALTIYIGQYVFGQDFEISRHKELESISAIPQLHVRVLIVVTAALFISVFEELLFRGLFQTTIRSHIERVAFFKRFRNKSIIPWAAIIAASILFTVSHEDRAHWPALFVLSCGMGYAYEKNGSLLSSIFIHILFNSLALVSTLLAS
jgi:membrane protease YdiL (CAAX protease family)